ncbi:hypothetical protein ANCDUO_00752 [Ancylostoma duodenale]|uniref:Uncharacterized protein n=1 Tax=Ancylostoma duodenale TaxID=51022 RepID=A0A0C2HGZ5_9BILA|nr:hypothetical protein ANCDUO_00752 [Ancylostoma duodenale]
MSFISGLRTVMEVLNHIASTLDRLSSRVDALLTCMDAMLTRMDAIEAAMQTLLERSAPKSNCSFCTLEMLPLSGPRFAPRACEETGIMPSVLDGVTVVMLTTCYSVIAGDPGTVPTSGIDSELHIFSSAKQPQPSSQQPTSDATELSPSTFR